MESAMKESESSEIEKVSYFVSKSCYCFYQAMLEDKLKSTDWDATLSSIEDAVARESYLLWLKQQEDQHQLKEKGEVITTCCYKVRQFTAASPVCVVFIRWQA